MGCKCTLDIQEGDTVRVLPEPCEVLNATYRVRDIFHPDPLQTVHQIAIVREIVGKNYVFVYPEDELIRCILQEVF